MRELAERALPLFGIEADTVSLLNHSFHTTFLVRTSSNAGGLKVGVEGGHGRAERAYAIRPYETGFADDRQPGLSSERLVLHVLRPDPSVSETQGRARVRSEVWWLDRLRADLDLPVPEPLRSLDGELVIAVAVEGMSPPRLCTLFRWIDGRFLYPHLRPEHLAAVGRLTARLHTHTIGLDVPPDFDRPRVDRADPGLEASVVQLFAEHFSAEAARVMGAVFQRVRRAQEELGAEPHTFGLIHADIHQNNYLFHDAEAQLIDFGDCGWGYYVYDLAVTIHQLRGLPQLPELRAGLLAGYREVRDLSPAHETLIDAFMMLREVQDISWFLQERDDPSQARWVAQIGNGVAWLEGMLQIS
jgi:Ser/Thr protein kinase RdoA (MazF antagonist)